MKFYDEEKQKRIRQGTEKGYYPISYSRIDRYEECPAWFKFEYIDKLGHIGSDKAELGTALHVFQELLFTDGIEKANEIATAMVPLSMSEDWENARKIIEQIAIKKDNLYAAEARFHYEFPVLKVGEEVETVTIQVEAKIDQLFVYADQGIAEVVDGKSGRNVEKDVEHDAQLKLYGLTVLKNLEGLDVHTIVGTQAQWRLGRLPSASWSKEQLEEFGQTIERKAAVMVNDQEFVPKPGTHCMWCPFVLRCDAGQKYLPKEVTIGGKTLPVIIDNPETAQRVGEGILHLEAMLARYKNSLRGFIKEFRSPVRVGEKTFDWHRHYTYKLSDLEGFIRFGSENNLDLSPYVSFNNTTGKTLIKNHPEAKESLVSTQWEKFEFRNPGEEED
jgi:hypothetical protein